MNPNGRNHHLHHHHVFTALKIFAAAAQLCFTAPLQISHANVSLPVLFVALEVTEMTEITNFLYICSTLWKTVGFLTWWLLSPVEIRFWGRSRVILNYWRNLMRTYPKFPGVAWKKTASTFTFVASVLCFTKGTVCPFLLAALQSVPRELHPKSSSILFHVHRSGVFLSGGCYN